MREAYFTVEGNTTPFVFALDMLPPPPEFPGELKQVGTSPFILVGTLLVGLDELEGVEIRGMGSDTLDLGSLEVLARGTPLPGQDIDSLGGFGNSWAMLAALRQAVVEFGQELSAVIGDGLQDLADAYAALAASLTESVASALRGPAGGVATTGRGVDTSADGRG